MADQDTEGGWGVQPPPQALKMSPALPLAGTSKTVFGYQCYKQRSRECGNVQNQCERVRFRGHMMNDLKYTLRSTKAEMSLRRKTSRCFGRWDDTTFDVGEMAQLSPLQAFGKLCSLAMLTTARVGDVEEDPSMSQARPRLAAINERGLVTTDSQMGLKTTFQDVRDGSEVLHWQSLKNA